MGEKEWVREESAPFKKSPFGASAKSYFWPTVLSRERESRGLSNLTLMGTIFKLLPKDEHFGREVHVLFMLICYRSSLNLLLPLWLLPLSTTLSSLLGNSEFRSCLKVEVAILGSLSLISLMVSVNIKQHSNKMGLIWEQSSLKMKLCLRQSDIIIYKEPALSKQGLS